MALAACLQDRLQKLQAGNEMIGLAGVVQHPGIKVLRGDGPILQRVTEAVQGVVRPQEEGTQLDLGQESAQGSLGVGACRVTHGARSRQHLVLFQGQGDHLAARDK
jgi:hypothetical protein